MNIVLAIVSLFIVQPLLEYILHRLFHYYLLSYHQSHHKKWTGSLFEQYVGDNNVRYAIILLFIIKYYYFAIVLFKYEYNHILSHKYHSHYLFKHHLIHHRRKNCNYAFSATWPDKLFGTFIEDVT